MFIPSIHYFRGIAIVTIVIGHCYQIANFPQRFTINFDTNAINILLGLTEKTIGNLISGGTALFVFISGFLFYHVFYKRFQYARFMHKKAINVFMPYIILSLPIPIQINWGLLRKYDALLARHSFSIYFFHAYVVEFLETLQFPPFTRYTELIAAIAFGTIVSTVCLGCLGVAWAIKRVVPNHSRMLIGA